MPTELPAESTLAAGQTLCLALDAGTVLLATQGRVRIDEAPRWLADAMVPVPRLLGEGQAHAVERSGWLRVTALDGAGARVRTLPVPAPRRSAALMRFVQVLRRA